MKTIAKNSSHYSNIIPKINDNQAEYFRTSTPYTLSLVNVKNTPDKIMMDVSLEGLTEHNYSARIVGNIVAIVLEKKKELTKKSSWGNISLIGNKEKYYYSIFERSDIFLNGDEIKYLESVKYDHGILKLIIDKKDIHS